MKDVEVIVSRLSRGYYVAKINSIRVRSSIPNVDLTREELDDENNYHTNCSPFILDKYAGNYIKTNYNNSYDWESPVQRTINYNKYLDLNGLDIHNKEIADSVIEYYPNIYSSNYVDDKVLIEEIYEYLNNKGGKK